MLLRRRSNILLTSQVIKFIIVGVTNTIVSFLIYSIIIFLLKDYNIEFDYIIAFFISFIIGVLWSYKFNKKFVFKIKCNGISSLLKSYFSYFFSGIVITNIISFYCVTCLGIGKIAVFFIIILFTFPMNFLMHKYWVFR